MEAKWKAGSKEKKLGVKEKLKVKKKMEMWKKGKVAEVEEKFGK